MRAVDGRLSESVVRLRYASPMRADLTERLLRGLYSAALYVLVPVTVYHLIWRGFRHADYFQRWNERYAAYREPLQAATIWVHAVSVGEVNAAVPLVNALLERPYQARLLVTTITPTGSARVRALWGDRVEHVYLPYDLPGMAQSQDDARRFERLGAVGPMVTGNLKFDVASDAGADTFAQDVCRRIGPRRAWIAASTHPDEEAPVLAIHRRLRQRPRRGCSQGRGRRSCACGEKGTRPGS